MWVLMWITQNIAKLPSNSHVNCFSAKAQTIWADVAASRYCVLWWLLEVLPDEFYHSACCYLLLVRRKLDLQQLSFMHAVWQPLIPLADYVN